MSSVPFVAMIAIFFVIARYSLLLHEEDIFAV